jgi:hypothetical protein
LLGLVRDVFGVKKRRKRRPFYVMTCLCLIQSWRDERCRFKILPRQEKEVTLQGHGLEVSAYSCVGERDSCIVNNLRSVW